MSDQVEIQLPRTVVEEEDAFSAVAYFRARATRTALAPTTVHYKVDCLTTKTALVPWTSVSAAANVSIPISSTVNAILEGTKRQERKQLLVKADDGLSTQVTGRTTWLVNNRYGVGTA